MTAAHAPGDHHYSPGGTRQLMRVLQRTASSVLMDACLAATGDLLNVAKALSVRVADTISASSLVRRPASGGSCPSECPSAGNAHRFWVRKYAVELGGAKRARTADLLHAMRIR
jgi:hypothetical protein